ncbi:MAG TPA: TRAP transporter large permease [Chromatiales bacterium]|nr:TRAP transporter large permease [Chromatiales bacterium]
MSPGLAGTLIALSLVGLLLAGVPVAFALAAVAIAFLVAAEGAGALAVLGETVFGTLDEFALLSIPMFILMGTAVAASRAGADLYEALDRWLQRVPGGLLISNLGACALFAALTGSSPATCAAIGRMGVPEMTRRGYPPGLATGAIAAGGTLGILIPPSITMIVYGIATETSIGRLFLAGVVPGLVLTALFMAWGYVHAARSGLRLVGGGRRYGWRERLEMVPRVGPFLAVVVGVLWALYGGLATPSEAAAVGALLSIVLVMVVYRVWRPRALWAILQAATRESVMIMLIIAAAGLFGHTLSTLYVTQAVAESIAALDVAPWALLIAVNAFLLVAGLFLPPVAVILMAAPTLLPIVERAGYDPVWFGVMLTINMEIGLITPPVGLNLYVIHGIAPGVRLSTVLWGALPFMLCMLLAIALLALFPELATWLPDLLMGPVR